MIKLTFTPDVILPWDDLPVKLITAIRLLHAKTPIAEVLADLKDPLTRRFLYRITTADAVPRIFKQSIRFDDGAVLMNFDVNDWWEEGEFVPHRDVRTHTIALLKKYPALTRIKYDGV